MKYSITSLLALLLASSALAHGPAGKKHPPKPDSTPDAADINLDDRPEFTPTTIKAVFLEQFTPDWSKRWSNSGATKETSTGGETFSYVGKWDVEEPHVYPGFKNDKGLVVKTVAAHHAISALFENPLDNTGKTLVVQYEAKFQNGLECGGAYLKLLTESDKGIQAEEFSDKTPYTIMFGPDKCGTTNKVHFIFRHKNPITGVYEEKHLTNSPVPKISKLTTLYTLAVKPDNTFEIFINNESSAKGSLLEDFNPPVNPPDEISDPHDKKPDNWVDDPKIPDSSAKKPADWDEDAPYEIPDEDAVKPDDWLEDEPDTIPDPDAEKPTDWVDDEDGEWIAPTVPNPKCESASGCGPWKRPMKRNPNYKGKWSPPQIDNPAYKGPWAPRKIPNPEFYDDQTPSNFEKIAAVGFELWTMQNDILFDNIYIGHSIEDANQLANESWAVKYKFEKAAEDKEFGSKSESEDKTLSFSEDPTKYLQREVADFAALAYEDPVNALKTKPLVAGGLGTALALLLTAIGVLFSLLGSAKKPVAVHKKTDEPTPDDEGSDTPSKDEREGSQGDGEPQNGGEPSAKAKKRNKGKKAKRDDE